MQKVIIALCLIAVATATDYQRITSYYQSSGCNQTAQAYAQVQMTIPVNGTCVPYTCVGTGDYFSKIECQNTTAFALNVGVAANYVNIYSMDDCTSQVGQRVVVAGVIPVPVYSSSSYTPPCDPYSECCEYNPLTHSSYFMTCLANGDYLTVTCVTDNCQTCTYANASKCQQNALSYPPSTAKFYESDPCVDPTTAAVYKRVTMYSDADCTAGREKSQMVAQVPVNTWCAAVDCVGSAAYGYQVVECGATAFALNTAAFPGADTINLFSDATCATQIGSNIAAVVVVSGSVPVVCDPYEECCDYGLQYYNRTCEDDGSITQETCTDAACHTCTETNNGPCYQTTPAANPKYTTSIYSYLPCGSSNSATAVSAVFALLSLFFLLF